MVKDRKPSRQSEIRLIFFKFIKTRIKNIKGFKQVIANGSVIFVKAINSMNTEEEEILILQIQIKGL